MNDLVYRAEEFRKKISEIKSENSGFEWYPYDTLANIDYISHVLPQELISELTEGRMDKHVLDIGPADGDLGYFFASRGCHVDFLDNKPTNFNDCKGIKELGKRLDIDSLIIEHDIDRGFTLKGQYDMAIALGILYHLRNPMIMLMELAHHAKHMVLSTRVATHFPDGQDVSGISCAYFLRCRESNNDPTNYWIFTPVGLKALLKRSGWEVDTEYLTGSHPSNPVAQDADARMFVYCHRVPGWRGLYEHHDF